MLDIIVFFIIATLSGMGVGSAGLLVVWLTVFDSVPQLAAQGLNLFFFLFSSSASLLIHVKRRKMFWGVIGVMTATGAVGALVGSFLANRFDAALLGRLFGGMLLVSGGLSLFRSVRAILKRKKEKQGRKYI